MNILLTNDDGIDAPGIQCLYSVLKEKHDVFVVAPLSNKSGSSSSFNMYTPVYFEKRSENQFALEGTPVDCVISAIKGGYLKAKVDVVFSGINADGNLGTDVIYSGTCAAARQASLYGISGIALSVVREKDRKNPCFKYEAMAEFALKNIELLSSLCGRKNEYSALDYFVNVNGGSVNCYKGARLTSLCHREYNDEVCIEQINGKSYSNCKSSRGIQSYGTERNDFLAVENGFVSISVLKTEQESSSSQFCNLEDSFIL